MILIQYQNEQNHLVLVFLHLAYFTWGKVQETALKAANQPQVTVIQEVHEPHFEKHCFQDTGILSLESFKLSLKFLKLYPLGNGSFSGPSISLSSK